MPVQSQFPRCQIQDVWDSIRVSLTIIRGLSLGPPSRTFPATLARSWMEVESQGLNCEHRVLTWWAVAQPQDTMSAAKVVPPDPSPLYLSPSLSPSLSYLSPCLCLSLPPSWSLCLSISLPLCLLIFNTKNIMVAHFQAISLCKTKTFWMYTHITMGFE